MYDLGIKASCASKLVVKCNNSFNNRIFWTVSGQFGKAKISIGDIQIPKRNEMVYATVLGGRLIGIGHNNLMLYHNSLNIPLPPTKSTFQEAQYSLLLACEEMAKISMIEAKKELCTLKGIDENDTVGIVASYDGAYQTRGGDTVDMHLRVQSLLILGKWFLTVSLAIPVWSVHDLKMI